MPFHAPRPFLDARHAKSPTGDGSRILEVEGDMTIARAVGRPQQPSRAHRQGLELQKDFTAKFSDGHPSSGDIANPVTEAVPVFPPSFHIVADRRERSKFIVAVAERVARQLICSPKTGSRDVRVFR